MSQLLSITITREGRRIFVFKGSDGSKAILNYSGIASKRSEPSSRASLMGEQPNPWDLLQPQDETSRHRGAEPRRRCGRLGATSLLSPE
jgi:hypothetical protein